MTNSETGRQIGLYDHIRQSIKNILFTRIGTRLMREEYGSLLPRIIRPTDYPCPALAMPSGRHRSLGKVGASH